jgi:zinc protease
MKPKVLYHIILFLFATIMGTMDSEIYAQETSPYLHKRILDNGITTIVKETPDAKVATVQLWVKAGSVYEEPAEGGITHVIEHMIFKGTPTRGPGEMAGAIESLGGQLNAYTSFEYTVYHATLSSRHWEEAMEVLTDAVLNATFDSAELEREKKVVLEEISMRNDRPEILLFQAMMDHVYSTHPYRRPVIGSVASVSAITREDMLAYRLKHYRPENLTVVVVGDVQAEAVMAKVRELMAHLPRHEYAQPPLPPEPVQEELRFFRLEDDIRQTHMALALPTIPFNHPDAPVIDVIAQILGAGEASRLHHRLRNEKGLVYRIDASSFTPRDQGVLSITGILNADNAAAALEAALEELFKLRYLPVGNEELARAKLNMESDFVFNLERVEGQARVLGAFEFLSGDPREDEYLEKIRAVTSADIQRVASSYFRVARTTAGLMLPAGTPLALDRQTVIEIALRADNQARQAMPASVLQEAYLSDVHRFELENGIVLLVRENPIIPTVAIRVVFPGGLRAESEATNGAFAFISQLLPRGTGKMDAREVALSVANMAGDISGFNGKNTFGVRADFLARFFEPGLQLVRDIVREPAFRTEEVEKVRPELFSQIKQQQDSLPALGFQEFNARLFQGHPYGLNAIGSEAAISKLTAADLRTLYFGQASPERMVIAVAGQVKAEEVREAVVRLFGDWAGSVRPAANIREEILSPEPPEVPRVHRVVREKEQVHIILGFLGTSLASKDRYGLEIIDTLLSGQSGRLFTELRDKHSLAYSLSSFSLLGLDTGSFGIYIGTSPDKQEEAIQAVWQELLRLREEPVMEAALQKAKNILISRYELGLQTHGAQAMDLALTETYGLGHDYGNRYIGEISQVDGEEVMRIARKFIMPDHHVMITVGAEIPATGAADAGGKE